MDLFSLYGFEELTNEAERFVIEELGEQLERANDPSMVHDEALVMDIAAYALNQVRPMYRATLLGRLYADTLRDEYSREVSEAVSHAIEKITSSSD